MIKWAAVLWMRRKIQESEPENRFGFFFLVEVRGIEPLSEDSVSQFSPSAVRILSFPPLHAP